MHVVKISNLSKVYGSGHTKVTAVSNVTFELEHGEIILIQGPSGSGKTTLLSIIGGLLSPSGGSVSFNGTDITELRQNELSDLRRKKIGFIFQTFNLLGNLTALENVRLVGELDGLSSKISRNRAQKILGKLGLAKRLNHYSSQLSAGEQQRVSIARALMNDPKVILADEPTGNLDSKSGLEVMNLFKKVGKEEGRSVIIVTHDQRIQAIADKVLWMEDGEIRKTK